MNLIPHCVIHPVEILKLQIGKRPSAQSNEQIDLIAQVGRYGFSESLAMYAEQLTGVHSIFWLSLQKNYEFYSEQKLKQFANEPDKFLVLNKYIKASPSLEPRFRELLNDSPMA